MISGRKFWKGMISAFLCACLMSLTACAEKKVAILQSDRLIETIPDNHCIDCHANWYDGRKIISGGYLLDIFKELQSK
ncbi:MAG: hypothetical protein ACYDFU_09465 [Nitrospirota bacterium]